MPQASGQVLVLAARPVYAQQLFTDVAVPAPAERAHLVRHQVLVQALHAQDALLQGLSDSQLSPSVREQAAAAVAEKLSLLYGLDSVHDCPPARTPVEGF